MPRNPMTPAASKPQQAVTLVRRTAANETVKVLVGVVIGYILARA